MIDSSWSSSQIKGIFRGFSIDLTPMKLLPAVLYNKFIRIKLCLTEVIWQYTKNAVIMNFVVDTTGVRFDTWEEDSHGEKSPWKYFSLQII